MEVDDTFASAAFFASAIALAAASSFAASAFYDIE
jgi:hypothetical protein